MMLLVSAWISPARAAGTDELKWLSAADFHPPASKERESVICHRRIKRSASYFSIKSYKGAKIKFYRLLYRQLGKHTKTRIVRNYRLRAMNVDIYKKNDILNGGVNINMKCTKWWNVLKGGIPLGFRNPSQKCRNNCNALNGWSRLLNGGMFIGKILKRGFHCKTDRDQKGCTKWWIEHKKWNVLNGGIY